MSRVWVSLLLASFAWPATALEISEVRATSNAFAPQQGESVSVEFRLDEPADVVLQLYDGLNRHVRSVGPSSFEPGTSRLTWDGRSDAKAVVAPEAYTYTLEAVSKAGTRVVHDLTDVTGSEPLDATDVTWDPTNEQIRYRLAQPARVNVRIGLQNNGPLLRTVIDWVPRTAGEHSEGWDGWDASHVLDLRAHSALSIAVDAYTLSSNTIFVGTPPDRIALPAAAGGKSADRVASTRPRKRMHYHAHQPLDQRGDAAISLSLVEPANGKEGEFDVVAGRVPIRLEVDPKDRERILRTRFEPVFFVDGTFAFENEVGFLPTTWIWDTTTVNDGWHYINVNVRGYEGNFGMATLKLKVENATGADKK